MTNLVDTIKEAISNLLTDNKIELVDISYRRRGGKMALSLLVDKEDGITLDDCTRLNEEIGRILDKGEMIPDSYLIEVSSPGLDRHLKTRRDFERATGKVINVHTYEPIAEKRDHNGPVESVDDEAVTVGGVKIPLAKISKARLEINI